MDRTPFPSELKNSIFDVTEWYRLLPNLSLDVEDVRGHLRLHFVYRGGQFQLDRYQNSKCLYFLKSYEGSYQDISGLLQQFIDRSRRKCVITDDDGEIVASTKFYRALHEIFSKGGLDLVYGTGGGPNIQVWAYNKPQTDGYGYELNIEEGIDRSGWAVTQQMVVGNRVTIAQQNISSSNYEKELKELLQTILVSIQERQVALEYFKSRTRGYPGVDLSASYRSEDRFPFGDQYELLLLNNLISRKSGVVAALEDKRTKEFWCYEELIVKDNKVQGNPFEEKMMSYLKEERYRYRLN